MSSQHPYRSYTHSPSSTSWSMTSSSSSSPLQPSIHHKKKQSPILRNSSLYPSQTSSPYTITRNTPLISRQGPILNMPSSTTQLAGRPNQQLRSNLDKEAVPPLSKNTSISPQDVAVGMGSITWAIKQAYRAGQFHERTRQRINQFSAGTKDYFESLKGHYSRTESVAGDRIQQRHESERFSWNRLKDEVVNPLTESFLTSRRKKKPRETTIVQQCRQCWNCCRCATRCCNSCGRAACCCCYTISNLLSRWC